MLLLSPKPDVNYKCLGQFSRRHSKPLGALGLLIVVALFLYYRRLLSEERKLGKIPAAQRAAYLDSALSRYKIDGSDIDPQGKFELIKLELEKRMSLVPRLVFVTATVFVICFLAAVVVQLSEREASPAALLPGDLTPIFGQVNHVNRVRNIPPDENADLLRRSMADAQQSIKIVTLNGSSWIHPDVYTDFVAATRRVPVTLLLIRP